VKQMNDFRKEQNCTGRFLFFLKRAVVSSADGQTFRAKGDRWITAAAGPPGVGLLAEATVFAVCCRSYVTGSLTH